MVSYIRSRVRLVALNELESWANTRGAVSGLPSRADTNRFALTVNDTAEHRRTAFNRHLHKGTTRWERTASSRSFFHDPGYKREFIILVTSPDLPAARRWELNAN